MRYKEQRPKNCNIRFQSYLLSRYLFIPFIPGVCGWGGVHELNGEGAVN